MVGAPFDVDNVFCHIFPYDIPSISFTTKSHSFSLADGIESGSVMLADNLSRKGLKRSWLEADVAREEWFEIALADEADASAVFFFRGGKICFAGDLAHLFFLQMANGKENIL